MCCCGWAASTQAGWSRFAPNPNEFFITRCSYKSACEPGSSPGTRTGWGWLSCKAGGKQVLGSPSFSPGWGELAATSQGKAVEVTARKGSGRAGSWALLLSPRDVQTCNTHFRQHQGLVFFCSWP